MDGVFQRGTPGTISKSTTFPRIQTCGLSTSGFLNLIFFQTTFQQNAIRLIHF